MDDKQKREFWQVKWEFDSRRVTALLVVIIGLILSIGVLVEGGITAGIVAAVVAVAAVAAAKSVPKELPEPSLELLDEKYRAKATGMDGINALALIAAFKEQEHARAGRLAQQRSMTRRGASTQRSQYEKNCADLRSATP